MKQIRILLVEDDGEMRQLLAQALRDENFEVIEASDGTDVLSMMLSNGADPLPNVDMIVTDVRMPGVTGLSLLERLRGLKWLKPMVLISAFADDELRAEAHKYGASTVLAKPFGLDEFLQAVRRIAPNDESAAQSSRRLP